MHSPSPGIGTTPARRACHDRCLPHTASRLGPLEAPVHHRRIHSIPIAARPCHGLVQSVFSAPSPPFLREPLCRDRAPRRHAKNALHYGKFTPFAEVKRYMSEGAPGRVGLCDFSESQRKAEHFKRGVAPQGRGRDGDGRGATVRLKCVGLNRGPGRRPLWGLNRAVSLKARLGMFGKNEFRGARTNNQGDDGFVRYQRRCRVACEGVDKSVWQRRSGGLVIRANRAQAAGT